MKKYLKLTTFEFRYDFKMKIEKKIHNQKENFRINEYREPNYQSQVELLKLNTRYDKSTIIS